ncbi:MULTISPECIES: TonB-dependent receptor [Sphingobium]|uniref:TonB-dependent receptor n=1 Tax=Sphingobium TaxID=165695 RepID=UPI00159C81D1|nr:MULTISPECIES: TonB-dependent receptor [unclassified Sphingobium]
MNQFHLLRTALLCASALASIPAMAQADSPEPASSQSNPDGASRGGVDDIIVTAQRREQSLQKVPVAVTALDATALAERGIATSEDLQISTPNLLQTTVNGTTQTFIRGVGAQSAIIGNESSIATYVDGVYIASLTGAAFGLNNVERVEVLRGPQGTLFGRNATGGVVQIITKTPTQKSEYAFDLSYANYETVTAMAYAAGGLSDKVAASVALYSTSQGKGFGHNIATGSEINKRDEQSIRVKLAIDLTDNLNILLAGDYDRQKNDLGTNRNTYEDSRTVLGGHRVGGAFDGNYSFDPRAKSSQFGFSQNATLDLGDVTLRSITAYREYKWYNHYDQDATPVPIVGVVRDEKNKTFQQEFLLEAKLGPADLTTGLFYLNSKASINPVSTQSVSLASFNLSRISDQDVNSYAAFGQANVEVLDGLNLTAGLRYTYEKAKLNGELIALPGNSAPAGTVLVTINDKQISARKLTWRFGADYQVAPDILLYASGSRGFKTGGFNLTSITQLPTRPETLDAYEIGLKTDLFDRQLRFNATAFHYDYSDIQLSTVLPGGIQTLNAASAKSDGLEFEVVAAPRMPLGNLQIGANLTVLDGKYNSFPNAPYYLPQPYSSVPAGLTCPASSSTSPGGNAACTFDAKGNKMIHAPDWTANVNISYVVPVGMGDLELSANYFHNDGFYWEPTNRIKQDAYDVVNAQIAYKFANDLRIRLFGRNLTNKLYYSSVSEQSLGDLGTAAAPRTYGAGIDFRF